MSIRVIDDPNLHLANKDENKTSIDLFSRIDEYIVGGWCLKKGLPNRVFKEETNKKHKSINKIERKTK